MGLMSRAKSTARAVGGGSRGSTLPAAKWAATRSARQHVRVDRQGADLALEETSARLQLVAADLNRPGIGDLAAVVLGGCRGDAVDVQDVLAGAGASPNDVMKTPIIDSGPGGEHDVVRPLGSHANENAPFVHARLQTAAQDGPIAGPRPRRGPGNQSRGSQARTSCQTAGCCETRIPRKWLRHRRPRCGESQ